MYIELLEEFGFHLNEPYIKKLDDEIWELRPLNDRILFAYLNENKFILLTYYIKDTRKTPKNELDRARKILENYKRGYEK